MDRLILSSITLTYGESARNFWTILEVFRFFIFLVLKPAASQHLLMFAVRSCPIRSEQQRWWEGTPTSARTGRNREGNRKGAREKEKKKKKRDGKSGFRDGTLLPPVRYAVVLATTASMASSLSTTRTRTRTHLAMASQQTAVLSGMLRDRIDSITWIEPTYRTGNE